MSSFPMTNAKKVLFLIPDGVGIRNYLYSDVIKHIKENASIVFWSPLAEEAFKEVYELHDIDVEYQQIKLPVENAITRLCREAATYARLNHYAKKMSNPTILVVWRRPKNNKKLWLLYIMAEVLGKWASKKYQRILKLERMAQRHWSNAVISNYKGKLKAVAPHSIFITHQRVAGLNPISLAAKELDIPTTTAIYSWDNLPKARLSVKTDHYLVWSNWMKDEMHTYYPEIPENNIKLVGTPQFDFYAQNERLRSKEEFASKYGLDAQKKWICFSGDDVRTSPYDPDYLRDIANALSRMSDSDRPQLIFRRCPADFSDRYDTVLAQYPELIVAIDPLWNSKANNWGGFFPKLADIDLQVNLAFHCEAVINLGSTMAHDFTNFGKPCLYINYDQPHAKNWSVDTIYKYQHFRTMEGLQAVGWLNGKDEIVDKLQQLMENPDTIGPDKELWMKKVVRHPLKESSKLIAQTLL
ncbi:hypothetical protein ACFQ1M_18005 [Sungkyunkwania multivorans]|uniref:UDP-glycosyltransferase n=1 Tax=Sungkyunkwania multivorans TaxID=1173618 RepID=A0ABW3D3H7_9FLAO